MNPFLDLLQDERTERPRSASSGRSVDQRNAQSYDLLGQMMKGVQRKR